MVAEQWAKSNLDYPITLGKFHTTLNWSVSNIYWPRRSGIRIECKTDANSSFYYNGRLKHSLVYNPVGRNGNWLINTSINHWINLGEGAGWGRWRKKLVHLVLRKGCLLTWQGMATSPGIKAVGTSSSLPFRRRPGSNRSTSRAMLSPTCVHDIVFTLKPS